MKKLKHFLALLGLMAFGLLSNPLSAQISEGGIPPSFAFAGNNALKSMKAPVVVKPDFDVKKQIEIDNKQQEEGLRPHTVARMLPVSLNVDNSGEWITLPNGTEIWTLQVNAPGAIAMYLSYDEFYIPRGGKLFIYNADRTQVLGAYTEKNNKQNKRFATEFVAGDQLILEYVAPASFKAADGRVFAGERPRIKISDVAYGYNNLTVEYENVLQDGRPDHKTDPFYGRSGKCNVNINCSPEGDRWQTQKKGVARMLFPFILGTTKTVNACTGTLINNTAQDLKPYFLTAAHCIDDPTIFFDEMVFYFHYEVAGCDAEPTSPFSKTMVGADLIVEVPSSAGSDGGLLLLYDYVPLDYGVYYNGWDRRGIAPTGGVGIHHPSGDVKKISTFTSTLTNGSWNGSGIQGYPNAHWHVIYEGTENGWGITEGGSSGSPIFNQDGLVFGTLTGGNSSCARKTGDSYYGKLWYHWDQHSDPTAHMKPYLDPLNTGAETLPGTYVKQGVTEANFIVSNENPYVLTSVTYQDYSSQAESWEWTFEGGEPSSYVGKEPPAVKYNNVGTFTTTLTINKGTADQKVANKVINVIEKGAAPTAPTANFTFDMYGGSILWTEGFDHEPKATVPPAGWRLENHGASAEQFIKGNFGGNNIAFHDVVDPSSVYSVVCKADPDNFVDSRLISNKFTLPENAYIEFWSIWDGSRVEGGVISVNISTDDGATFEEVWTNGPGNNYDEYWLGWHFSTVMLPQYAGQEIQIIFRFYGQGPKAYYGGFDGVKVGTTGDPTQQITIGKGETVTPVDLSIGPPTIYKWEFPGAETTTSDQQNPGAIQYMVPGLYDVILTVENSHGQDTRVFEDAVNVVLQTPEPNYLATSTGGYTLTTHGPFAPHSARVNLKDFSKRYPEEWSWTFEGATPANSTVQDPGWIEYNSPGEFDLTLRAANDGGEAELVVPGFAKIGYESSGNIWNMVAGEDGMDGLETSYGHLSGTNTNIANMYAEKFPAPAEPGFIESVDIMFHVNHATSGNLTVRIRPIAETGLPSTSVSLAQVTIPVTSIEENGYTTVTFPNKVFIDQPFCVVVEGFRNQTNFDLYITSSPDRGKNGKNTAYVYYYYNLLGLLWAPWGWAAMPDQFDGVNVSLNIAPNFSYMYTYVDGDVIYDYKNVDHRVSTVNVKSNTEWSVKPLETWIVVDADPLYDGDGSFTFKVLDNVFNTRKGVIEISNPAGILTKYVIVQQAGPAPYDLTATVVDEDAGEVELAWERPNILTSIFDGAEQHTAWAINSSGPFGWSYIDGDEAITKGMGSLSYPGRGSKMAFQVFNIPLYPSTKYDPHFARSGTQIFACVATSTAAAGPNDDWMISPALTFEEDFTFSFWAKAYASTNNASVNYDEVLEVTYSTTGNEAANFTVVATEHVTDKMNWVKFEYTIPANAKHVAIHCISNFQHMLMIDDIYIGTGVAPQSMYTIDPSLNADPFAALEGSVEVEEYTPEQLQLIEYIKSGKAGAGEPITITNTLTGEVTKTTLNAPSINVKNGNLKLYEGNAVSTESEVEQFATEDGTSMPITKLGFGNSTPTGNAIGFDGGQIDVEVALRFTTLDLLAVHNSKIKAVDVYLGAAPLDGITINIRQNENIIHSQKVNNLSIGKFVRVTLNKDVYIDASKDMYVGYAYTQKPNAPVAATDGGPAIKGKGDLISENGATFQSLSIYGLSYNWLITAIVEDHHKAGDILYTLYRDGAELVKTKELSHLDQVMTTDACYTVTAVYPNDLESTTSNDACVELKALLQVIADDISRYVGQPNPELTFSITGDFAEGDTEATMKPLFTISTPATIDSEVGDYPIELSAAAHDKYRFAYHNGTLTVKAIPALGAAPTLTASIANDVNVALQWTAVTDAVSYNIYREGVQIATVSGTTHTDNALTPGREYCYTVKGISSMGAESDMSNVACATVRTPLNPESNAFTPFDKDGINDVFMKGARIEVVNRYGQSIFNGRDGWDGTRSNGQLVAPGTYYYKAVLPDGRVLRGSVEAIKK